VTPARLALLRAFATNAQSPRKRERLAELVRLDLVSASGPALSGRKVKGAKASLRPYAPTANGCKVLEVADRIVAEQTRHNLIVEQTRHDVAASVARHASVAEPRDVAPRAIPPWKASL
jgi:hypothetical protein